jgi:hypothetical protein
MAKAKSDNGLVRVKILTSLSGVGFSYKIGELVEIEKSFADELIKVGFAELV